MRLNLGCGTSKIPGFINVDIDPAVEPDIVFNFTGKFPYEDDSIEEIVAYHVFEHIPKKAHEYIYNEIYRVLKADGTFNISFPEFDICVNYWRSNYRGMKEFWEATIYGRQASSSDYHVCIMKADEVARQLIRQGFGILHKGPEPLENHNSIIKAVKMKKFTYQEAMLEEMSK